MRIAWTGEVGARDAPGVAGLAFVLLEGLAARGHAIDVHVQSVDGEVTPGLAALPGVRVVRQETWWRWERWYSRGRLAAFLSSSVARIQAQRRLGRRALAAHEDRPYDVVFQMSQFESFLAGRRPHDPPLVVHPCTIARSEAHWHRRERRLARRTEGPLRFLAVDVLLHVRARLQRRHARAPDLVVGPSETFVREIAASYAIPPDRCRVLRHPAPRPVALPVPPPASDVADLLFVSRISSRKGVELVVELSRRLADLAGRVRITVVGGQTLWSDYSGLLEDLEPSVARYVGELPGPEVLERMGSATALLVPSRFEPGSIATGEALSLGLPVIAGDAVGPSEILSDRSGRVFADGDAGALERAVRSFLADHERDPVGMRTAARAVAVEHLDRDTLVRRLEGLLEEVATRAAARR